MNLSERFRRSWILFRTTWHIMKSNPKLMLFPLISNFATIVAMAFFLAIPIAATLLINTGHSIFEVDHWKALASMDHQKWFNEHRSVIGFLFGFGAYAISLYIVSIFLSVFFNTAFYHQILKALAGEDISIREGLAFAFSRLRAILLWSLLTATVGVIIKAISERLGFVGNILMRFVGAAWSVASIFVIPIIVRDNTTNPLLALKNSVQLLRRSWGEALIGYVGVGMFTLLSLLLIAGIIVANIVVMLVFPAAAFFIPFTIIAVLAIIIASSFFSGVADAIYRCALYSFAAEGVIPEPFTREMMDAAWKIKKA